MWFDDGFGYDYGAYGYDPYVGAGHYDQALYDPYVDPGFGVPIEGPDSEYAFTFVAYSGDQYAGSVIEDTGALVPGAVLGTSYGYYAITGEAAYGYDLGPGAEDGTVYVSAYADYETGIVSAPYYYSLGSASGTGGLGSELDYAFDGVGYQAFGQGGAYQVAV